MGPRTSYPDAPVVVDGNSRTTLAVMVGAVIAVCGVVSAAAVAQYRISGVEESVAESAKMNADQEKRIQRIEDHFEHIARALEKVDAKLERLAQKKP